MFWCLLPGISFSDFSAGQVAFEKGDYKTALHEWEDAAARGDAAAQKGLARLYERGLGVPRDHIVADGWMWRAAEAGDRTAQANRGWPWTVGNEPVLICKPITDSVQHELENKPAHYESLNASGFRFNVALRRERPALEPLRTWPIEHLGQTREPNLEITLYRVENGQRIPTSFASSLVGQGGSTTEETYLSISMLIEPEELERMEYARRWHSLQASEYTKDDRARKWAQEILADPERLKAAANVVPWLPNRAGKYEIVCRYHSHVNEYWSGYLEAETLQFEFVDTGAWSTFVTKLFRGQK
jgi:hypothetical protein